MPWWLSLFPITSPIRRTLINPVAPSFPRFVREDGQREVGGIPPSSRLRDVDRTRSRLGLSSSFIGSRCSPTLSPQSARRQGWGNLHSRIAILRRGSKPPPFPARVLLTRILQQFTPALAEQIPRFQVGFLAVAGLFYRRATGQSITSLIRANGQQQCCPVAPSFPRFVREDGQPRSSAAFRRLLASAM
jgi:hypothetical protein